ncbi:hypothetical protein ACTZWW_10220 [Salinarimonas sp. NSM]|uniref:hypothetical protein n=1 Tax=Salinarimonas sp. NSM TaxID=3458003 RepID=UPI0040368425
MGCMTTIDDDALWAKHLDDEVLAAAIRGMREGEALTLLVAERPIRFVKMRNGLDGRPTNALEPLAQDKPLWDALQPRRGEPVSVALPPRTTDPYLLHLDAHLREWASAEDEAAFDEL